MSYVSSKYNQEPLNQISSIIENSTQIPSNFELPKLTNFKFHADLSLKGSLIFYSNSVPNLK
jgi:hypothetical protein